MKNVVVDRCHDMESTEFVQEVGTHCGQPQEARVEKVEKVL